MRNGKTIVLLLGILSSLSNPNIMTAEQSSDRVWSDIAESAIAPSQRREIVPIRYRTLSLNLDALVSILNRAPAEKNQLVRSSGVIVDLPLPLHGYGQFQIVESPIMAPELAARYPEIRTYLGQGIDDPTASVRFDVTPAGFHAMILSAEQTTYIDPYSRGNTRDYICYLKQDLLGDRTRRFEEIGVVDPNSEMSREISRLVPASRTTLVGEQLRTYRLALAATGEYTAFFGGTVALGMAAIVTAMNRVDGVYEKEVAIRMVLVANNDQLVYTNATTDPYTNNNGSTMLGQNQTNIDAVIGSANYDIGHVFSTGGGGVAYLGVVCRAGQKAGGVTGSSSPTGDSFWIDYVVHEMGHQFGGNHTFNSVTSSCGGGNRNASTAYEPGSGTTIMAYAGICGADDTQPHSDDYFHVISIDEIVAYTTTGSGNSCPVVTSTGNGAPAVSIGSGGTTIPFGTPFSLTGSATDPNGDTLTYTWEEFDIGPAGSPNSPSGNAPIFRSFKGTGNPTRLFPKLSDLLNNTQTIGEILPSYTRNLSFRLTARDNRAGGGGVGRSSTMTIGVSSAAGPFLVTSPNTAVTWTGGGTQTITWNVANTSVSPVSCANVKISLSVDGGLTWPYVLAASTPNDGSQSVVLPNLSSTTARVKVEAVGNVFFDISNVNFTITPGGPTITVSSPNGGENWAIGSSQTISWSSSGVAGNVRVQLSRNGGSTFTETLFAGTANDGSEPWTVTGPVSSTARVRISSVADSTIIDTSNANFSIVQPSLAVTSPNGGESWPLGSSQTILWTSSNLTGNVKIDLSTDGGLTFPTVIAASTPNDGTEPWTVSGVATPSARIRISSLTITSVADTSNANFTIVLPAITVTSPNGGENWPIGSVQTVLWTSSNLTGNVKIDLSTDGGLTFPTVIAASTPNDGTEPWTVSGVATPSARIRISSLSIASLADTSNANFTIVLLAITVVVPNGGEVWGVGTLHTIQWTSSGVSGTVNVELSRNGGLSYETLFAGTPNNGLESWAVTSPTTSNALIRVSSVVNPAVTDVSNGAFAISANFSFLTKIILRDHGGESDSLEYGAAAGATDTIDALYGEIEQPPLPPGGVFDVRWQIPGTEGTKRDIRDTLSGARQEIVYTGWMQPGVGSYPFVLKWNRAELPAGFFTLRDGSGGIIFSVNMKQQDSLVVTNLAVHVFEIVYTAGSTVSSTLQGGWNIVSVPVTVADRRKALVFPPATSSAFAFTPQGYVNKDTLEYGAGYWLKFASTQLDSLTGGRRMLDTIDVVQGWNIIGSISTPVTVGSIVQIPGGIVTSPYYEYTGGAYGTTLSINPMQGYWVKVNQNGRLVLVNPGVRPGMLNPTVGAGELKRSSGR